ncbi:hypothetical protein ACJX0J_034013 [Zea mays]
MNYKLASRGAVMMINNKFYMIALAPKYVYRYMFLDHVKFNFSLGTLFYLTIILEVIIYYKPKKEKMIEACLATKKQQAIRQKHANMLLYIENVLHTHGSYYRFHFQYSTLKSSREHTNTNLNWCLFESYLNYDLICVMDKD